MDQEQVRHGNDEITHFQQLPSHTQAGATIGVSLHPLLEPYGCQSGPYSCYLLHFHYNSSLLKIGIAQDWIDICFYSN